MDIKARIDEIINRMKQDKNFSKKFTENPVKAVEDIVGIDLPDEQINAIVNGIKSKMTAENIADVAGKLSNLLGGRKDS